MSYRPLFPPFDDNFPPLSPEEVQAFGADLPVISPIQEQWFRVSGQQEEPIEEKVIKTKTNVLDAVVRTEPLQGNFADVLQSVDQFVPENAKESSLTVDKLKEQQVQLEHSRWSMTEIHQETIIGWTERACETYLVNPIDLGELNKDIVPMNYTIFPVFVAGAQFAPCTHFVLAQQLSAWREGLYLTLELEPGIVRHTVNISIYKKRRYSVTTYQAELFLSRIFLDLNMVGMEEKRWSSQGSIDRILDKDNSKLGIFGMYAGGPLPWELTKLYGQVRLTWDHPFTSGNREFESVTKSILRYEVDFQRGSTRIGYFMSKDALLVATETKGHKLEYIEWSENRMSDFRTLMKESTYVVGDGVHTYTHLHCTEHKKKLFLTQNKDPITRIATPHLVIVREGVNGLNICRNGQFENFRDIRFFSAFHYRAIITLDWQQIQAQLDLSKPLPETKKVISPDRTSGRREREMKLFGREEFRSAEERQFHQVMAQKDFKDFVILHLADFSYDNDTLLMAMKQEPRFFPSMNQYIEYWHVYGLFRQNPTDESESLYHYLATISIDFNTNFRERERMEFIKFFVQKPLFPEIIDLSAYPGLSLTQEEKKIIRGNSFRFKTIFRNKPFLNTLRNIVHIEDIRNPSQVFQDLKAQELQRVLNRPTTAGEQQEGGQESGQPILPGTLRQVMSQQDFNDYVVIQVPNFSARCNVLLLTLREPPKYFFREYWRYIEYWHVYALLREDQVDQGDSVYHYVGSVGNSYIADSQTGSIQYQDTKNTTQIFTDDFDPSNYPEFNLTEEEEFTMNVNVRNAKAIRANHNFRDKMKEIVYYELQNPGQISVTRSIRIEKLLQIASGQPRTQRRFPTQAPHAQPAYPPQMFYQPTTPPQSMLFAYPPPQSPGVGHFPAQRLPRYGSPIQGYYRGGHVGAYSPRQQPHRPRGPRQGRGGLG